jgi:Tfp pilus assembly protein PilX
MSHRIATALPLRRAMRRTQHGVVLFIALIVLVAMSLAGIALVRGVDTANLIAGNLAFRQGATQAGDTGLETSRSWVLTQSAIAANLINNNVSNGYYAAWATWDFTGANTSVTDFDWSASNSGNYATVSADAAGNTVKYVIHRMCDAAGDTTVVNCIRTAASGSADTSTKGGAQYGSTPASDSPRVFYRITARIEGPRNTVSYVQSVMN